MKIYNILLVLVVTVFFGVTGVSAQESTYQPKTNSPQLSQWQDSLNGIKSEIKGLLEENRSLDAQYESLKQELLKLQDRINEVKVENRNIVNESKQVQKQAHQEGYQQDVYSSKIRTLNQRLLKQEGKAGAYKDQLQNLEETLSLWRLQVDELSGEKKNLELELQLQESKQKAVQDENKDELHGIEQQVKEVEKEKEDVLRRIRIANRKRDSLLKDIEGTEQNNRDLEKRIADLKQQKKTQIRENAQLERKNARETSMLERKYPSKQNEKRRLEANIKKLETKLESVKGSVQESLQLQEEKRTLIDDIMRMDQDNQKLRQKISDLRENIAEIKAKIGAYE